MHFKAERKLKDIMCNLKKKQLVSRPNQNQAFSCRKSKLQVPNTTDIRDSRHTGPNLSGIFSYKCFRGNSIVMIYK